MNGWQCEHPGCPYKCIGVNGAMGLRAIGWFFIPGKSVNEPLQLFCPYHHPGGYDKAIQESKDINKFIYEKFDIENPYTT